MWNKVLSNYCYAYSSNFDVILVNKLWDVYYLLYISIIFFNNSIVLRWIFLSVKHQVNYIQKGNGTKRTKVFSLHRSKAYEKNFVSLWAKPWNRSRYCERISLLFSCLQGSSILSEAKEIASILLNPVTSQFSTPVQVTVFREIMQGANCFRLPLEGRCEFIDCPVTDCPKDKFSLDYPDAKRDADIKLSLTDYSH